MTLRRLGRIGDRDYAVQRDPATDEAIAYVCLTCMQETKPTRETFERHRCRKARESAPDTGGEG